MICAQVGAGPCFLWLCQKAVCVCVCVCVCVQGRGVAHATREARLVLEANICGLTTAG